MIVCRICYKLVVQCGIQLLKQFYLVKEFYNIFSTILREFSIPNKKSVPADIQELPVDGRNPVAYKGQTDIIGLPPVSNTIVPKSQTRAIVYFSKCPGS